MRNMYDVEAVGEPFPEEPVFGSPEAVKEAADKLQRTLDRPDMSVLCQDWTPSEDCPVVQVECPPGKVVALQLDLTIPDDLGDDERDILLLQASAPIAGLPVTRRLLWELRMDKNGFLLLDPDPVDYHLRRYSPLESKYFYRHWTGLFPMNMSANPVNGGVSVVTPHQTLARQAYTHLKPDEPWRITIGCPPEHVGLRGPEGWKISCRWEVK